MSAFDDRPTPSDYLGISGRYDPASEEFAELRELLLGGERRQLEELQRRIDALGVTPEELAEHLPEAIALRAGRDRQLARALAPTVESAITESVRRDPAPIATAIFPVLGPAIRKAIAEAMAGLVHSINRAIEHSFSVRGLRWRVESWRTGVPYAQIVLRHALVYRVEQVFLIHAETGLLLGHASPPELKAADGDLISGMLTAIQDFVADSFAERDSGGLRSFSVGELNVLVERGPQAVLAAVVRGQAPDTLLPKMQGVLETIHFQLAPAFAAFGGDAAPFAPAQPLLEECLETVLSTDQAGGARGGMAWLRWAIPALLVVLLLAGLAWRSHHRWAVAMARLKAEPGIEIVEAARSGGRWQVRGLRDPLAASAGALLGADSARLEARWEPYLSLEPSIVERRVRSYLAAPATVTLALRGDTVVARGPAPLAWVGRALSAQGLPPGVSRLDLSGVEAVLPPALAALRDDTEGRLVLFESGSAALDGSARAMLAAVAASFRQLRAAALELGYRADLELIGRTDATGTDAANQALSRLRVEAAQAGLAALGLARGELNGSGVGTSRPLPARKGADPSRVNRSVAFVVHLSPATAGRTGAR
jgi:outer membrane protein OmpA-like peptidoglycan-associated protein